MFGLFDGVKYRNEVTTQIHAILMLMPHLKSLTSPLKDAINAYRKEKTPEIEAAVWLSLAVIENLMVSIPPDTRLLTVQYLNEKKDGKFRWFANYAQAVTANQRPEHAEDVPPPLAAVIGFAFWYLLHAVQTNKLSENVCRTFVQDVIRMLRQNERDREQLNWHRIPSLAALKTERASEVARGRQIETEAAPIRYVAELLGTDTDSEKAIRWLIASMVLSCDPLAIALTAAASARRSTA